MVAQCADSSVASSSSVENSPSLDIIIDDHHHGHQHEQQPFVFGTNLMQLVSNLLLKAFDNGQFSVVEQLLCWHQQGDNEWSHTLCLLLNELRTTRHCTTAIGLVRVVAHLLRMVTNHTTPSSREQLRKRMKALRFDELMLSLRDRFISADSVPASFGAHLLLEEAIEDCLMHINKTTTTAAMEERRHGDKVAAAVTRNSRTDADSGTFSGDEEEMKQQMVPFDGKKEEGQHMMEDQQQQIGEIIRLVHALPTQEVPLLAKLLRTNNRSLCQLVSLINHHDHHHHHHLDNSNCQPSVCEPIDAFEKRQTPPVPPTPLPPPPPPPPLPVPQMLLSATVTSPRPLSASNCGTTVVFPSAAPPPPPPPAASLVRPPPAPPLASPATCREPNGSNSPLPAAEIPNALRPKALPDQCRRLRHLQWTKLPTNAVAATGATATTAPNCANVWQTMEAVDKEMRDRLDFAVLDAFFGCPSNNPANISSDISHRSTPSSSTAARRRSSMMLNGGGDSVVSLLDAKRSLSVNVFLKMCRDNGQLLNDLAKGKADKIGADRLRTISHLLPTADEQKLLRDFSGDKQHMLGAAEQFLLALIERIPAHRLQVEAMLFRLDLQAMLDTTSRPNDGALGLKVWLMGCQELLCSSTLRKVLYALLHLGNYLNHGAGAGNAVGFRLSSLWKVEDVKTIGGTTRGRTLLHFVAQQVDNCARELAAELQNVREAAKSSLEAISDDVRNLSERMHCLEGSVARTKFASNSSGGDNFLDDFLHFLEESRPIIVSAERQLAELGILRRQVATFLCEQERNFSLEECFKVIAWFVTRFEKAVEDNRRFMERDKQQQQQQQNQQETGNHFRKPSPDSLDGMALKSVVKKRDRQSFALVDERERQQTPQCPPSSPGKMRRRRTAHSVTPLLDTARLFLNALEESAVEKAVSINEVKDGPIEQSLEAVVDQALMKREIVGARETKCAKIDEEKKEAQQKEKHEEKSAQQLANSTGQPQEKLAMAQQPTVASANKAEFVALQHQQQLHHQQQQIVPLKEETNPSLQKGTAVPSSALATMSTKAKKHLLVNRNSTINQFRQKTKPFNDQKTIGQRTMPERAEEEQRQQFGTVNNSKAVQETATLATVGIKPNTSRMPMQSAATSSGVRTAQKRATANLATASKRGGAVADPSSSSSLAPKCTSAVCRIRIGAKSSSNIAMLEQHPSKQQSQQQKQDVSSSSLSVPDPRPLKPSQVKANQPTTALTHGAVGGGTFGRKATTVAPIGPLKMGKCSTTPNGEGTAAAAASCTTTTAVRMKSSVAPEVGIASAPTWANANNNSSRRSTNAATECQQQQEKKDGKTVIMSPSAAQQQQHYLRPTKPTLMRRLSTSSRPTLVHSTGRSCTAGNREKEKPKWI